MEEVFKNGSLVDFFQEMALFVYAQLLNVFFLFETILKPLAAFGIADIAELTTDAIAVGFFEFGNDF